MPPPNKAQALHIISTLLSEWLGTSTLALESRSEGSDWVAKWKGRKLLIEYKRSTDTTSINAAIVQVTASAGSAG